MSSEYLTTLPGYLDSGSPALNLALSGFVNGGWARGRVANLIGDSSAGKTQLAFEMVIRALMANPKDKARYFDKELTVKLELYKKMFGNGEFWNRLTLDQQTSIIEEAFGLIKDGDFSIEIIDSLDVFNSFGDAKDSEKYFEGKGSYNMAKPKAISIGLGHLLQELSMSRGLMLGSSEMDGQPDSDYFLMVISQVRDNVNAGLFGPKKRRSGGQALEFDSSQIVWITKIKTLTKTIEGNSFANGIKVKAKVSKNKIAWPFKEAEFDILFNYGVDTEGSLVDWLLKYGPLSLKGKKVEFMGEEYTPKALRKLFIESDEAYGLGLQLAQYKWDELEERLTEDTSQRRLVRGIPENENQISEK